MATGWKDNLRLGEDGFWYYRFKVGVHVYEGCTWERTKTKAREWLFRYRANLSKKAIGIRVVPSFRAGYLDWMETKRGKVSEAHINRTKRAIEPHVLPYIGETPADQVTKADIEAILTRYMDGYSERVMEKDLFRKHTGHGANTLLLYIKMIYGHLEANGLGRRPWNVEKVQVDEPVRTVIPIQSADTFFDAVNRTRNLHQMLAVRVQFWMGFREMAAVRMRWEWFTDSLRIYMTGKAKNRKAKAKPVEEGVRALLWALIWEEHHGKRPRSGWVMLADDGLPHRPQFTKKAVLRGAEALELTGVTPHRLRASLATNLARLGKGAHVIKEMLDHKSIETSEKYVRLGTADLENVLDDLKEASGHTVTQEGS